MVACMSPCKHQFILLAHGIPLLELIQVCSPVLICTMNASTTNQESIRHTDRVVFLASSRMYTAVSGLRAKGLGFSV